MNNMKKKPRLTVYYDGLCVLCSSEIDHYRKQVGADQIQFVDICGPSFDAVKEGLDPFEVHRVMHVRRADGSLAIRVQAFIEIWSSLPKYKWAASLAKKRTINQILEIGYTVFAKIRPFLPRRKKAQGCEESPYCEVHGA
jgi:predicted DCC family thiol-disulfide oxidoreductase YuxK